MQLRYPTSFLSLLLVGFAIVTLPLIAGLVSNAFSIERLSEQSQKAVYNATLATQSARQLSATALVLERTARFFAVSGDKELLESYKRAREAWRAKLAELAALPLGSDMTDAAQKLGALEAAAFDAISITTEFPGSAAPSGAAGAFPAEVQRRIERQFGELSDRAQQLNQLADKSVDAEVDKLRTSAARSRNQVFWQMLAMVPSALLLIAGFTYLLARPIRDLDAAINRLGEGKLAKRIRVTGPRDIEMLGQQLDWLRQRLIVLEDQKTRFFQHISHELKTPLTALREGSDLLAEELVGQLNSEQREVARILKQNSQSLERLIQDLLTYSQAQSEQRLNETRAVSLEPLQLLDLIDEVLEAHKLELVAKTLAVRRQYEKVSVTADHKKMRTVIDNLISNAIKYSPHAGTITVRLVKQAENAVIEVLDDGPGIAPEDRERIFEPFYRSDAAIRSGTKGTGLGLAIVRDYVELHRGTVSAVASSSTGARIRVILPRQPAA
jgi:two-component system sensor histidine kinase GlrK